MSNDFINGIRILLGGKENWTDDNSQRTYRAANDTNVYNTDMNPYLYKEPVRSGINPVTGSQYVLDERAVPVVITDTTTSVDGGDTIDNAGNVTKNGEMKNLGEEREKDEVARKQESRNDNFISLLRGLFGLFTNEK